VIPGDVIVSVAGKSVDSVPKLLAWLDDYRPGDEVTLVIMREGRKMETKVQVQAGR
jgi:S1-C subfamily serine protease